MREHWSSRLGLILAALGSAIGLGTLWKFPYVTSQSGGGLFVLLYLFFTLFFGIPIYIGELLLGRKAQRGAVGVFSALSGETSAWRSVGWLAVLSSFLILSYYCVVAGWGLNYLMLSLNQFYESLSLKKIGSSFDVLFKSGDITLFWAFIFLLMVFGVVLQGVRKGIEKWARVLTTSLMALVVLFAIYASTLEGFPAAFKYLFQPTFKLSGVLEALGLSLFTLSLAQGIVLTYGSYAKFSEDLPKIALAIGITVVIVSVLVILIIFPVIFTFHLKPEAGAGLIFKTLPVLFASLPGSMVLSTLFFTLFVFTALTASLALMEVIIANFIDLYQWSRKKASLITVAAVFIFAIPSALAGSGALFKAWPKMFGLNFLETVDALVSIWLLPIGALLFVFYLGWHLKKDFIKEEFVKGSTLYFLFPIWFFVIRYLAPVGILLVFLQKGGFLKKWTN